MSSSGRPGFVDRFNSTEAKGAMWAAVRGMVTGAGTWGAVAGALAGAGYYYSPVYKGLTVQFKM